MRKRIVMFMSLMLTMIMATGVVFAATLTREVVVDSENFNDLLTGTYTKYAVTGTENYASSRITNVSSTDTFYLITQNREYLYNVGWTSNVDSTANTSAPGGYAYVSIPRDVNLDGYYYFLGKCMGSANSPAVYDTFNYEARQTD